MPARLVLAGLIAAVLLTGTVLVTVVDRSSSAPAAAAPSPAPAPATSGLNGARVRVAAIGDSLTRYDDEPEQGHVNNSWFARVLRSDPAYEYVYNASVVGDSTRQMRERLEPEVLSRRPDLVLILGGINDIASGIPTQRTLAELRHIVVQLMGGGARAVLGTVPPWDDLLERDGDAGADELLELNDGIRRLGAELAITVIDFYGAVAGPDGRWLPGTSRDGLHPNDQGVALMAEAAIRALHG